MNSVQGFSREVPRRRRRARRAVLATLVVLVLIAATWALWPVHPRTDRNWLPEFTTSPRASFEGSLVHITGVRDFRWQPEGGETEAWDDRNYDLDSLTTVWFALSPFDSAGWRGPAHTFLCFGFGESTFVTVSVEARKELGETYSVWKGLVRRYELLYVVADERDVFPRRALVFRDPIYLYPVRATKEKARALFVDMLERSNALHDRPEYYNTVTNNCTNNLLKHVNRIASRRIHGGWRVILPGYSDELAYGKGFLDTDLPLAEARETYRVNEAIAGCALDAGFSACIRGGGQDDRTRN